MPDSEDVLDTSYFQCRYQPSFSDKQCFPTNENGDSSESGSSGCLSNDPNEEVIYAVFPQKHWRSVYRCVKCP